MKDEIQADLLLIQEFLRTPSPEAWFSHAHEHIALLLCDHAHCERKAAFTALNLMNKYPNIGAIQTTMPALAREELLHFEKVLAMMHKRNHPYYSLKPSGYAKHLHAALASSQGMERLCYELLTAAIIEARSCERFAGLVSVISDRSLAQFYLRLVKAEARHFETYLTLAQKISDDWESKLDLLRAYENNYISTTDPVFRFHSGVPLY